MTSLDSFRCCKTLKAGSRTYAYFSLPTAERNGLKGISRLPFSMKVLLENLLRNEDGRTVTKDDIKAMIDVSYRIVPEKGDAKGYQVEMAVTFRKRPDEPEVVSKKLAPVKAGSRTPELQSAVENATRALLREAGLPENPNAPAPAPLFPRNF